MGRSHVETIQPNTEINPVQEKNVSELIEAGQQASIAQAAIINSFDVIKAIGRLEAASFFTTVGDKLIAETAINVRETKSYKGLPYKDAAGNVTTVGDFQEFCKAFLGKSYSRTMELVSNYNALGPDLYEQAEKIGFRQRDYNALKALPSDDRLLIAQAIEEENLDKALDLMQEMAAKHLRDREALTTRLAEQSLSLEAKDRVIKDKTEELNKKAERLAALEHVKSQPVSPEQRLLDLRSNLQIAAADIKTNVMVTLRKAMVQLHEQPGNHALYAAGLLAEISRELNILRDEYDLPTTISDAVLTDSTWAAMAAGEVDMPLPSVGSVVFGQAE